MPSEEVKPMVRGKFGPVIREKVWDVIMSSCQPSVIVNKR